MTKPRIFINIHYLEIGGAETSLIGLLMALDPEKVDVDLFLNDPRGEMMQFIPSWVNVLPAVGAYTMVERPMKEALRKGYVRVVLARLWAKYRFGQYMRRERPKDGDATYRFISKYVVPQLPSLHRFGEYDLALAFITPPNILPTKVKAKRKIGWFHTDYRNITVPKPLELSMWEGYDRIVSISEEATKSFTEKYPELADRVTVIENILSPRFVRMRADSEPRPADMPQEEGVTTLLTVGRFSYPKKLEEIPIICRRLTEMGDNVRWYIIGYGVSDQYIRDAIEKEGMQGRVVLLGKRANPYPYMKACDWYVQPSRFEGKSVTVREAQMLRRPVIITAYKTAPSQVQHGNDGLIVPMPALECAAAMHEALNDASQKEHIIHYLSTHDYGNEREVEKIYQFLPCTSYLPPTTTTHRLWR